MADLRTLTLGLLVKDDQFRKGLKNAQKNATTFGDKLKTALKAGAAAFAAIGAAAGAFAIKIGKDAINAASDFNEELSKSEVVLGDAAKSVQEFARSAAQRLGQSRTEALRAASNFAIFGKSAGLSGKALADFSTDFVTLASDLASFNNTSPEQAVNALGAALRGESEPIRAYGVLLNEATLRQKALELGIIDNIKNALTPQQKILAAQAEIFAQTSDAQGDFERTSDGLANTQRQLKAAIEDVKIELGEALLPKALEIANKLKRDVLPVFETFIKTLVGGQNSLDASSYFAYKAQENLGEKMDDNEWAGYNLAMAIRNLAEAFGELFGQIERGTGKDSGLANFINGLSDVINRIADAIRGIDELIDRIGGLKRALQIFGGGGIGFLGAAIGAPSAVGAFNESRAQSQAIVQNLAQNQRRANTAPIVVNVRGGLDNQKTAREIAKVLTQERVISGVRVAAPAGFF